MFAVFLGGVAFTATRAFAQEIQSQLPNSATLQVTVRDVAGKPVAQALVRLERLEKKDPSHTTATTSENGMFVFSGLPAGKYKLSAEKLGARADVAGGIDLSAGEKRQIEIVLEDKDSRAKASHPGSGTATMELADEPNFTVAGITDWTAAGGHGSDTSLRTSEDLAREAAALKADSGKSSAAATGAKKENRETENKLRATLANAPGNFTANHELGEFYLRTEKYREAVPLLQAAYQMNPRDFDNEFDLALACKGVGDLPQAREHIKKMLTQQNKADLHRVLGDIEEQAGDPLAAVREHEQAARLDPSEQNYFAWGSELLLHRAVQAALEVFGRGAKIYPKSERMLAALGATLFASGMNAEGAQRVCAASDLNPGDTGPYIFLAKMEMAAPMALPCVDQKLARFAREQSGNAAANYYYATALWKRLGPQGKPEGLRQVESLLNRAVSIDPKFSEAYLQLGIVYFAQGNFDKAIEFYKKAIALNSELSEAHYRLGVAYERAGRAEQAQQEFQRHDEIEKAQAAAVERQRKAVREFLVVLKSQPASSAP
ncbi:MAG: hypothetical protein NVS9B4_09990 [Candidatus Acidiferrum sp.]